MHFAPVCAATLPAASTMAHWRTSARGSPAVSAASACCGVARLQQLQPKRAVAEVDVRLRRHRTHARQRPRHGRAHLEVVRLHRNTELTGFLIARNDGVCQSALIVSRDGLLPETGLVHEERFQPVSYTHLTLP